MRPIAGSPRVDGDEEEEDTDDLENEFDIGVNDRRDPRHVAEALLSARLNTGRGSQAHVSGFATPSEFDFASVAPEIPLLTYGEEVDLIVQILLFNIHLFITAIIFTTTFCYSYKFY
jgi:hypothetical protein